MLATLIAAASLLIAADEPEMSPEAKAYLDTALALIEEHHYRAHAADWDDIREAAYNNATGAQTPSDTHRTIQKVIFSLGERHSFLRLPTPAPPPTDDASTPAESSGGGAGPKMPRYTLVGDQDIGFVQLFGLDTHGNGTAVGDKYRDTIQAGLEYMDDAARCGWIVDLRQNTGGNMWPMLAGLDPLLGDEPFGYFHGNDGEKTGWYRTANGPAPTNIAADMPPRFTVENADKPIAVLVAHETTSSGEMTAMAFMGRDNVRTFGWPTGGFVTANSTYPLSDGALLILTTSNAGDRTGEVMEKLIIPDVIEPAPSAHFAAIAWLKSQCED